MRTISVPFSTLIACIGFAACMPSMGATRAMRSASQDHIEVLAHFSLTQGPVNRLLPTHHYSRDYLYTEATGGKMITVIDITDARVPALVAKVSDPTNDESGDLLCVTGTAALIASPLSQSQKREFRNPYES
jgi:hypothetical protein